MTNTLNTISTNGIVLTSGGADETPFTITSAGAIQTTQNYGLSSSIANSYLLNEGAIHATYFGVYFQAAASGTVVNHGVIASSGDSSNGIVISGGGQVTNAELSAQIYGTQMGVELGAAGSVYNDGNITGDSGFGIALNDGGSVTNSGSRSQIFGGFEGLFVGNAAASVENQGTIKGASNYGIFLASGGFVQNSGDFSLIDGGVAGVKVGDDLEATATVTNDGTITGGSEAGIIFSWSGDTLFNAGTISGGTYAVIFGSGDYENRLIINPGAVFNGIVKGVNILELAPDGSTIGTITPAIRAQFTGFDTIQIDLAAIWDFAGNQTINTPAALLNNGIIRESGTDRLTIDSAITGTGTIDLSKKTLTLNGPVASTQRISFSGTNESLDLGDPKAFKAEIEKFAAGDTIDLASIKLSGITGTHFAGGVLTLTEASGKLDITFASPASFGSKHFALFKDGSGTGITLSAAAAVPPLTSTYPATAVAVSPTDLSAMQGLLTISVSHSSLPPLLTL